MRKARCFWIASIALFAPAAVSAQAVVAPTPEPSAPVPVAPTAPDPAPASAPAPLASLGDGASRSSTRATLTLAGYVEAFYQWNFNVPDNGITNYRGFDNRHNGFTLANVVLDATGTYRSVTARLALQVGHTPESYYLAEPSLPGAAGAGFTGPQVWKYLQQANVAWRAPVGQGLLLEAGVFLSPVGPEGMAVREQWNWSRSNLFFGLPFYHSGLRASYPLTPRLTASVAVFNGWNSVVDGNPEKSLMAAVDYVVPDRFTFHALYFSGVERAPGAPERAGGVLPWRHLFDAYTAVYPLRWLSFLVHANAGFEPTAQGISWWAASALYVRLQLQEWLYVAARGDIFYEHVAEQGASRASPIFWPSSWVSSGTVTIDARPQENVSLRLEYRHDHAAGPTYFGGAVPTDSATGAFVPNANAQDTLTLGMVAGF